MILMFSEVRKLALVCALVLLSVAACANPRPRDGRLQVIAELYPLAWVAERVGGDLVDVTNLTTPGAEPHDLELTARQVASMARSDLVIYEKGLAQAVDGAVEAAEPAHMLDTAQIVPEGVTSDIGGEHADPHTWLDPVAMQHFGTAVADQLAAVDPAHAEQFRGNAQRLSSDLAALDRDFSQGLAHCVRTEFVTSHSAFGYLAQRYHLQQIGISGLSSDSEPSPSRIREIHDLAKQYGITTIFYETLVSPALADAIAADLRLRTDVLDPLEGISDESRGTDYLSVMRSNLAALRTANGCS